LIRNPLGLLPSPNGKAYQPRWTLIRSVYLFQAKSALGKTVASDDKKTSPAPKNETAVKKEAAAKKVEGQPKDKTSQM
jgi:hypothetical protein